LPATFHEGVPANLCLKSAVEIGRADRKQTRAANETGTLKAVDGKQVPESVDVVGVKQ
jgi:hypothetical protein